MQTLPTVSSPQVVAFRVAGRWYALPAISCLDVLEGFQLTRVPGAVAPFVGLVPYQGRLLPVADPAPRLAALALHGAAATGATDGERVALLFDWQGQVIALAVEGLERFDGIDWTPDLALPGPQVARGLAGGHEVRLLDLDGLLARPV